MIFDLSEQTFRNELYADYKAHRPDMPEDLVPQFPLIRDAVRAFNVACLEQKGYEADDLIATYAREALEAGADVTIVSSDKDLMQLVRPGVRMYDTMKNKVIGEDEVMERFGVPPSKVIEVQALIGDPTDNVPGVPGIGVKTAALLINEYGDLDTLLARASEITQPKRRESLITFADQARLSRTLVILDTHVPLDVPLAETLVRQPEAETLLSFMRRLEFSTLLRRIADGLGVEAPAGAAPAPKQPRKRGEVYDHPLRKLPAGGFVAERTEPIYPAKEGSPLHLAEERAAMLSALPFDRSKYETVVHPERLAALLDAAREQGHVAFRAKVTSSDPMQGELVGVALSLRPGTAVYIPLGHRVSDGLDLGGEGEVKQMKMREALDLLEASAGRRDRAQDRAERQVRHGGARPLRHRAHRLRRSLPHVLCARRRPRRASAGAACRRAPVLYLPHARRRSWAPAAPPSPSSACPSPAPPNSPARRRTLASGFGSC